MNCLEYAERAGKGDPEVPGSTPPATIIHNSHSHGFERQRDRLSLSRIYRGRLRHHPANAFDGRTPAFDPFERGNARTGRSWTAFELPGNGFGDHDPMQASQDVQVA